MAQPDFCFCGDTNPLPFPFYHLSLPSPSFPFPFFPYLSTALIYIQLSGMGECRKVLQRVRAEADRQTENCTEQFLAHSKNELMRWRGVCRLSVCLCVSVCL